MLPNEKSHDFDWGAQIPPLSIFPLGVWKQEFRGFSLSLGRMSYRARVVQCMNCCRIEQRLEVITAAKRDSEVWLQETKLMLTEPAASLFFFY